MHYDVILHIAHWKITAESPAKRGWWFQWSIWCKESPMYIWKRQNDETSLSPQMLHILDKCFWVLPFAIKSDATTAINNARANLAPRVGFLNGLLAEHNLLHKPAAAEKNSSCFEKKWIEKTCDSKLRGWTCGCLCPDGCYGSSCDGASLSGQTIRLPTGRMRIHYACHMQWMACLKNSSRLAGAEFERQYSLNSWCMQLIAEQCYLLL